MTNTLNTPIEALEHAFPFRVTQYAIRHGSGGKGQFPGGMASFVKSNSSATPK